MPNCGADPPGQSTASLASRRIRQSWRRRNSVCAARSSRDIYVESSVDLIEDLEFHLIVYHPYRSLVHLTGRDSGPIAIRETMLDMEDNQLQVAWFVQQRCPAKLRLTCGQAAFERYLQDRAVLTLSTASDCHCVHLPQRISRLTPPSRWTSRQFPAGYCINAWARDAGFQPAQYGSTVTACQ